MNATREKRVIKTWSRASTIVPADGRSHDQRAQRQGAHPGVRHREHGRAQARRVLADAHLQGSRRRQGGGEVHDRRQPNGRKPRSRISSSSAWARANCAASPMRFAASACARRWCCCKFAGVFASEPIEKLLKSAVANAENNHNMSGDGLYITKITVDGGPGGGITKRLDPRAQGRANFKRKRMSHVTIVVERDAAQARAAPARPAPRSRSRPSNRAARRPRSAKPTRRARRARRATDSESGRSSRCGGCGVMGQKIHPVGLRLGITRTWDSRWFEKKNYQAWLHEDVAIRKYFGRMTRAAAISKVEIERRANQARVIVHTGEAGYHHRQARRRHRRDPPEPREAHRQDRSRSTSSRSRCPSSTPASSVRTSSISSRSASRSVAP